MRYNFIIICSLKIFLCQVFCVIAFTEYLEKYETFTQFWTKKWNESGFRPPLCTDRLNWVRRTSWGWWDDWDDTVLQTQDSKFEPWRSEAEHATSRSRRLPTILTFTRGWGRNIFVSFKPPRPGTEPRTLAWKAAVLTTTLGPTPNFEPTLDQQRLVLPMISLCRSLLIVCLKLMWGDILCTWFCFTIKWRMNIANSILLSVGYSFTAIFLYFFQIELHLNIIKIDTINYYFV